MSIFLFAVVTLCLAALIFFFLFRPYEYGASQLRFKKIGKSDDPANSELDTQWRSVRIRPGLVACKRVESIKEQIFLAREVPPLPLENCNENTCNCHYLFLDDRRSGLDRRAELAKLKGLLPEFDRRENRGRRVGDLLPA